MAIKRWAGVWLELLRLGWRLSGALAAADAGLASRSAGSARLGQPALNGHPNRLINCLSSSNAMVNGQWSEGHPWNSKKKHIAANLFSVTAKEILW